MPSRSVNRVAARFIFASVLDQAGRDVAKGLSKVIKDADIPAEARRYTKHFRELEVKGNTGWVRTKKFDDVISRSTAAQNYMSAAAEGDEKFKRQKQVEENANAALRKMGIIGRSAK